jgi:hypothetical protein
MALRERQCVTSHSEMPSDGVQCREEDAHGCLMTPNFMFPIAEVSQFLELEWEFSTIRFKPKTPPSL